MDIVTLRKLAMKSKLTEGKFENFTVEEIIKSGRKLYLVWLYYNIEKLTFVDEVLDAINIFPEDRIEKPGKDPEKWIKISIRIDARRGRWVAYQKHKAIIKRRIASAEDKEYVSKSQLQAMNHGHIKFK